MAKSTTEKPSNNLFYRDYYQTLMVFVAVAIFLVLLVASFVHYQLRNKPLPSFTAISPNGATLPLIAQDEPNLLPDTLIKWVSKGAVAAYTFDFVNYNKQFAAVRPYFTSAGWSDYQSSVARLINTITQNQLFVNGVVSGAPIIASQGDIPGKGYAWRIQIPFLVTYQSAETTTQRYFTVLVTVIKVSTTQNPKGIGIDQFVMAGAS